MNATEFKSSEAFQILLLRKDGTLNFNGRTYAEMQAGIQSTTELWWGLDRLYAACNYFKRCELSIFMKRRDNGFAYYVNMSDFYIEGPSDGYRIRWDVNPTGNISTASSNISVHNNKMFTTADKD